MITGLRSFVKKKTRKPNLSAKRDGTGKRVSSMASGLPIALQGGRSRSAVRLILVFHHQQECQKGGNEVEGGSVCHEEARGERQGGRHVYYGPKKREIKQRGVRKWGGNKKSFG